MADVESRDIVLQGKAIAFAGLLHDIGKLLQRAGEELCPQSKKIEGYLCPSEHGRYTHSHVLWTDHFFREIVDNKLLKEIFGDLDRDNVANLAAYHHKPDKQSRWQQVIQKADHLSAKERETGDTSADEAKGKGSIHYKKRRLSPIFEIISLDKPLPQNGLKHHLKPLSLGEEVFPGKKVFPGEEVFPCELSEDLDLTEDYKRLWNGFRQEFVQVQEIIRNSNNKFDLLFNAVYSLLHKYTWCVPSFTQDKCYISLFDHMRTTAALAHCLYLAEVSNEQINKPFLLVEGDISGIQRFIYKLASPAGVAHVARILRGRSFYLTLLPYVLAKHIIWQLGLTVANILWCSGGKFDLLLPNTSEARNQLSQIRSRLEDWFFAEFEGELGIVFGEVEISATENEWQNFGGLLKRLHTCVEEAKTQKFLDKVNSGAKVSKRSVSDTCRVCGLYEVVHKNELICAQCSLERDIGSYLPKARYLVLCQREVGYLPVNHQAIKFGEFGIAYLTEDGKMGTDSHFLQHPDVTDILAINELSAAPLGFTTIGKEVAIATEGFTTKEGTGIEAGHILPFEQLAQMSEGDERLGVLKMDLDELGLIFARGLPQPNRTISAIATLSRMLDWFFSGYINIIARQTFRNWQSKDTTCGFKDRVEGCIYTIYSGGDDLLVVAPWSEAVEFAARVHREFKKFACSNSNVDLSSGLYLCKPKFTISRAATLATTALGKSKREGRRRICLFDEVVTWDGDTNAPGLHDLLKLSDFFTQHLKEKDTRKRLPRRFLYSLLILRKRFVSGDRVDQNAIPLLLYIITKNVSNESIKLKLVEYFINGGATTGYFKQCVIPASIALLKTRQGG